MSIESIVTAGRRLVATTLLDACVLSERKEVKDSTGGKKETWLLRNGGVAVACRFVALTDDEPTANLESVFGRAEASLLLPLGTVFAEGDRVLNSTDGSKWQVVGVLTPPSNLATVARAAIRAV